MLRSEVIAGIQDLRYRLEKMHSEHRAFEVSVTLSDTEVDYFDSVLSEARLAVLLNEQNDPHAPHMR
jgi:hypothetical protein